MLKEIEKSVIGFAFLQRKVLGVKTDWSSLYLMLYPEKENATRKSITEMVSRWKNSADVQIYLRELEGVFSDFGSIPRTEEDGSKFDSNLAQSGRMRTRKDLLLELNALADKTTDTKTRTDILKTISQFQLQDADLAKEVDKDIMRFYVPMNCYECPIYKEKKEQLQREGKI